MVNSASKRRGCQDIPGAETFIARWLHAKPVIVKAPAHFRQQFSYSDPAGICLEEAGDRSRRGGRRQSRAGYPGGLLADGRLFRVSRAAGGGVLVEARLRLAPRLQGQTGATAEQSRPQTPCALASIGVQFSSL